jgi:hypothetical protein
MVRRALEEPKAIRAGRIPQASFAMSRVWMSVSNVESTRSRSFDGREDIAAIVEKLVVVERRRGCKKAVRDTSSTNHIAMGALSQDTSRVQILTAASEVACTRSRASPVAQTEFGNLRHKRKRIPAQQQIWTLDRYLRGRWFG